MRVVGSRLLIRKIDEIVSKNNVIEVVKLDYDPSQYAQIVAVGEIEVKNDKQHWKIPIPDLAQGDTIITKKHCGVPVEMNNETLYFIELEDALAVVEM